MKLKSKYIKVAGTNYEVGKAMGEICKASPQFLELSQIKDDIYTKEEMKVVRTLFDKYCQGINEEIEGFSEATGIASNRALYYVMTYLKPGCSIAALLSSKTELKKTLMLRNYEFSPKYEPMELCHTSVNGKYKHLGASILSFGREDGINEHGLVVAQSSTGIPVSNTIGRKPAITGLQFWAVIRTLLENCKNVDEAIALSNEMPIAYNINLMLADANDNIALLETFDGNKAHIKLNERSEKNYLHSTNHIHFEELKHLSPLSMKNSVVRYDQIAKFLDSKSKISVDDLKYLSSAKYPEGLCCNYYEEIFGTLRAMIFDPKEKSVEVCFGSPSLNKWRRFEIDSDLGYTEFEVEIVDEKSPVDFYEWV